MEIKQGALSFDIENSLASLLGFRKIIYKKGRLKETDGNVIIEPDKNTMKCLMEIKQGALSFDIENSLASLLGFIKIIYKKGR